jgi:hypothetical protein
MSSRVVEGSTNHESVAQKLWGTAWRILLFLPLLVIGGFIAASLAHVAVWAFPESEWAYKLRYKNDPDLSGAQIIVMPKPHDCAWGTAPIGEKNCHYEKQVGTVRVRPGANGGKVVSTDDGASWEATVPQDKSGVIVTWTRIED